MKIATWNMWSKNRMQKEALKFLFGLDVDVMCLQELQQETVDYLQSCRGYSLNYGVDHYLDETPYYNAIVSKMKPLGSHSVAYQTKVNPRLSIDNMPRLITLKEGVSFQYNDYCIDNSTFRVFNLHLFAMRGPTWRIKQLKEVSSLFSGAYNVVCGDLNTYAKFPVNVLIGWMFRFGVTDYHLNDLRVLHSFADKHQLTMGVKDVVTSRWHGYTSHLDHILIPHTWHIQNAFVHEDRRGSDHHLVLLETVP